MEGNGIMKEKKFEKPGWTVERLIILLFLLYIDVCCIYTETALYKIGKENILYKCLLGAIIFMITYIFIKVGIPYNWTCMEEVRRYLTFQELQECLENQTFEQLRYEGMDVNRNELIEVYFSEEWISVDGVIIPKNSIMGIYKSIDKEKDLQQCVIFTVIGGIWIIGEELSADVFDSFYKEMKTILSVQIFSDSPIGELKKYKKKIETKQEYVNLISNKN